MSENGCDRGSFFKGFLIGGALGAIAALLFAPKSGKELRADIKRKSEEAVEGTKRVYGETRDKAQQILAEATEKAQELREEASRQMNKARAKAEEILNRAEEKAVDFTGSARGLVDTTKADLAKKKDKITTALNAGIDAAKKELGR
ncbi:MAG TPA: YtxH domain-containing protein [bacterium]|nr:YtxH domain-containing protein [bacterium]HPN33802.1 YtxH domain-containing protein [bacterium]